VIPERIIFVSRGITVFAVWVLHDHSNTSEPWSAPFS